MAGSKWGESKEEHRESQTISCQPGRTNTSVETIFQESAWKIPQIYGRTKHENHLQSTRHKTRTVYARTRKNKNRKATSFDEIPLEVWKTKKFDNIMLWYCNSVYNQNIIDRGAKGCILPLPKKGEPEIAKNCRGITLTSIAAKIYNALLLNCIEPEIEKILWKNQNGFQRKQSISQISVEYWKVFVQKKPCGDTIICWLHTQREDGANTSHLECPQKKRLSHNDAI